MARRFFNTLAEEPETVAAQLVPQIRAVKVLAAVKWLWLLRLLLRLVPQHLLHIPSALLGAIGLVCSPARR